MAQPAPGVTLTLGAPKAGPGDTVAVSVSLAANGAKVATIVFGLDYDERVLTLDATDANHDGTPDAVQLTIPAALNGIVSFNPARHDGEIDVIVTGLSVPLPVVPDGTLATVTFHRKPGAAPGPTAVRFAQKPAPSFGSTAGGSLPGSVVESGQAASAGGALPTPSPSGGAAPGGSGAGAGRSGAAPTSAAGAAMAAGVPQTPSGEGSRRSASTPAASGGPASGGSGLASTSGPGGSGPGGSGLSASGPRAGTPNPLATSAANSGGADTATPADAGGIDAAGDVALGAATPANAGADAGAAGAGQPPAPVPTSVAAGAAAERGRTSGSGSAPATVPNPAVWLAALALVAAAWLFSRRYH